MEYLSVGSFFTAGIFGANLGLGFGAVAPSAPEDEFEGCMTGDGTKTAVT